MPRRFICAAALAASLTASLFSVAAASHPAVPLKLPLGWPQRVMIPRIGVSAHVESLALTSPADAHAPYRWGDVAWFDKGAKPGDLGRAAVFGHVDSTCCPAVFYHLRSLKKGDIIEVAYKSGPPLKFRVLWQGDFANSRFPSKFLFSPVHERGLALITCAGIFHTDGSGYDHKLIVYARLILPNGKLG